MAQHKRQSPMQRMLLQQRARSTQPSAAAPLPLRSQPTPLPLVPLHKPPTAPPIASVTSVTSVASAPRPVPHVARPHNTSPQQQALLRLLSCGELKRGTSIQSLPPPPTPPPQPAPPPPRASSYPHGAPSPSSGARSAAASSPSVRPALSPAVRTYRPPVPEYGIHRRPARALLVGIGYRGHRHLSPLAGSRHDVENMLTLLLRAGFDRDNIRVLCDELTVLRDGPVARPTSVNILRGLSWVARGLTRDDCGVFYFAGHGDFVPDVSGDEESGFDQCILPVDYEPRPAHDGAHRACRGAAAILDDTIYERLVRAVPPGAKVTAVVDACRSGSVCDLPVVYDARGTGAPRFAGASTPRQAGRPHMGAGAFVLFSGSADDEMSAEMTVGGGGEEDDGGSEGAGDGGGEGGERRSAGIMTCAFIEAVEAAKRQRDEGGGAASYGELVARVRAGVRERAALVLPEGMPAQEPQLSTSHAIDVWQTPFMW